MPIDAPVAITVSLLHDTTVYVPVEPFIGALTATMPWPRLGIALFIEALTANPLKMLEATVYLIVLLSLTLTNVRICRLSAVQLLP